MPVQDRRDFTFELDASRVRGAATQSEVESTPGARTVSREQKREGFQFASLDESELIRDLGEVVA